MSIDVSFTDTSAAGPSGPITAWAWDFGDTGTSAVQNPVHTYAAAGRYTVQLTVTGTAPDGTDDIIKSVNVGAGGALTASYANSVLGLVATFHDTSAAGPSGPITGWAWNFGDGATSTSQNPTHTYAGSGTYTVTLTVTGTGGDGTSLASGSTIVGGTTFVSTTAWTRPAFTPARTVNFTTRAGLDAAISGMQAGDLIRYTGSGVLTISSSSTFAYAISGKNPTGIGAMIDFGTSKSIWDASHVSGNYVKFDYTGTKSFQTFKLSDCSNLNIYGGDITASNQGNGGIGIWTSHDILWYDAYIHDIGGSGVGNLSTTVSGAAGALYNLDIRAEVNRFAMNPGLDTHTDKGCGEHACIIHGGNAGGTTHDCRWVIYGHDPLRPGETSAGKVWPEGGGGSCIEPGNDVGTQYNLTLYALAENMLMQPNGTNPGSAVNGETGGNAINFWGKAPLNGTVVGWVEANNCSGGCTHGAGGPWGTSASPPVTVLHGRHNHCNLYYNTAVSSNRHIPYDTVGGIVYHDNT